jgi:hypothetical protein
MSQKTYLKDPEAVLDWVFDWSDWLAVGETILSRVITVATGLVKDSDTITGGSTTVTVWLSGAPPACRTRWRVGSSRAQAAPTNAPSPSESSNADTSLPSVGPTGLPSTLPPGCRWRARWGLVLVVGRATACNFVQRYGVSSGVQWRKPPAHAHWCQPRAL